MTKNRPKTVTVEDWKGRITVDPAVCHGKPCIKGTRIWVSLILDFLASGDSVDVILREYPQLTETDVLACLAYGAEVARERFVPDPNVAYDVKFKLDENLGPTVEEVFRKAKLDFHTVSDERLNGADDPKVLAAAVAEGRVLVTMDFDFSNIIRYPPDKTVGIAVLSTPGRASRALLRILAEALVSALTSNAIRGKLWIVEPGRIREHEPDVEGEPL